MIRPVAPDVYVAPQLGPEHMAQAAAAGIRSIINNRPDHEHGPGQPEHAAIEAACRIAGLEYRFLPVSGMQLTAQNVADCADLLAELPRPLLMFCRSGTRSANLYALASAQLADRAD